jgi:hypothetical protein
MGQAIGVLSILLLVVLQPVRLAAVLIPPAMAQGVSASLGRREDPRPPPTAERVVQ